MLLYCAVLIITKNVDSFKKTGKEHHLAKIPAGTDDIGVCHYL